MFKPFYHPLRQCLLNDGKKLGPEIPPFFDSCNFYSGTISNGQTQDVTIAEVVLSRSLIVFCGCRFNTNEAKLSCTAYFLNSTTVRLSRGSISTVLDTICHFFVVEISSTYVNSTQEFLADFGGGSNILDVPISEVDLSKSFILKKGFSTASIITNINYWFYALSFLNSTTVRAERSSVGAVISASFSVLELK